MKSSSSAASLPARRMPSNASGPWILIRPSRVSPGGGRLTGSGGNSGVVRIVCRLRSRLRILVRRRLFAPARQPRRALAIVPVRAFAYERPSLAPEISGNEILSGRTADENLAFLARGLNEVGIRLREARVIPDLAEVIIDTVDEVRRRFDYVFTTGGIGPTHDDITAQCIADAFGVPLVLHPDAKRLLETHYLPGQLNAARLRMAMVPQGAALLPNPISRAPGFQIGNVYVLPGVPNIMRGIFEQLKYRLAGGDKVLSRSVSCALGEGTLAADLAALQERWPDIEIGSYPYFRRGDFGVTLVLRGTDRERLAAATEAVTALIRALGGEPQEGLGEG